MKVNRRKQSKPVHWTLQVPWLLAFFWVTITVVIKFDHGQVNRLYEAEMARNASLLDLNSATQAELETLPDIGPVLAKRMIISRPFMTVDDLERVPGIGPTLIKRILPKVTVKNTLLP